MRSKVSKSEDALKRQGEANDVLAETIYVQATEKAGERVVLWERDERHPGGEIYIYGNDGQVHEVFSTQSVKKKLSEGLLVEVEKPEEPVVQSTGYEEHINLEVDKLMGLARNYFKGELAFSFRLRSEIPPYEVKLIAAEGRDIPGVEESALLSFRKDGRTRQARLTAVKRPQGCFVSLEALNNSWSYFQAPWQSFLGELKRQGWNIQTEPQLSRLERGILEVYEELRNEKVRITNGIIASRLLERGIYPENSGSLYSDEHISRKRTALREKGYKV